MPFKFENKPNFQKNKSKRVYISTFKGEPLDIAKFTNDTINHELGDFLTSQSSRKMIYSTEGVYTIKNNDILKVLYMDGNIEHLNKNNISCLIDDGYEKYETIHNIPYSHISIDEEIRVYKHNNKSLVELHIITVNNKVHNIYFVINDSIEHDYIINAIFSFLSLLTNVANI